MQTPHTSFPRRSLLRLAGIVAFCLILLFALFLYPQGAAQAQSSTRSYVYTSPSTIFSPFAGNWWGHGRSLTVTADGHAHLAERAYVFCSAPGAKPPCDTIIGNQIRDGVVKDIVLISVSSNTASGTITASTAGDKGKTVSVVRSANDLVQLMDTTGPQTFCGDNTSNPYYYCGA